MDKLLDRIWQVVESLARPAQIIFVLFLVTGAFLFDAFGIVERFGVESEIAEWNFWLLTIFLISGTLLLTTSILVIWKFASKHSRRISKNIAASRVNLSFEAETILVALIANLPDPIRMHSAHPAVRELRYLELISSTNVFYAGDYQDYRMTEKGEARAFVSDLQNPIEDQLDRMRKVMLEVTMVRSDPHGWMAR